eukprot:1156421-Pelagomonas_calceolata.AAC.4
MNRTCMWETSALSGHVGLLAAWCGKQTGFKLKTYQSFSDVWPGYELQSLDLLAFGNVEAWLLRLTQHTIFTETFASPSKTICPGTFEISGAMVVAAIDAAGRAHF